GAPLTHEDDAERAVHAGLRILEAIEELNEQDPALSLQVRIGINTGEAVVALGARPEEGAGIATGDVVNTASRLQGAAPGEGIAFWALGEIVKAECGILESDAPEETQAKLERALPPEDPDRPWLKSRLQPLVGAGGEPASQEESFMAWRRCLESWAEARETILVFEDLHWADQALLSFLEHPADWSAHVQPLLLCTT